MSTTKRFTNATGAPVADNTNIMTAGPRGPARQCRDGLGGITRRRFKKHDRQAKPIGH